MWQVRGHPEISPSGKLNTDFRFKTVIIEQTMGTILTFIFELRASANVGILCIQANLSVCLNYKNYRIYSLQLSAYTSVVHLCPWCAKSSQIEHWFLIDIRAFQVCFMLICFCIFSTVGNIYLIDHEMLRAACSFRVSWFCTSSRFPGSLVHSP